MSDELLKTIASIATLLTVLVGLWVSMQNRRMAKKITTVATQTAEKLDTVHQDVNGKMTALLAVTGASERAAGIVEGRQAGISERADRVAEEERVEDRTVDKLKEKDLK